MRNACSQDGCSGLAFGRGLCSRHYQSARSRGELPEMPAPRPCDYCGVVYQPRAWRGMYCSARCNDAARFARSIEGRARRVLMCDHCGGPMDGVRVDARFCSAECGQRHHAAGIAARLIARKLGRTCRGCGESVAASRRGNALYCSDACKISSRRHEKYGLTKDELALLLSQHEVCAICRTDDWKSHGPVVDHDHATGAVRGILCGNCNTGLGQFRDDPALLRRAAKYLTTG